MAQTLANTKKHGASAVIIATIFAMVWSTLRIVPKLGTDLTAQLTLLATIGISLFLLYGLVQIKTYLRPKK